MAYGNGLLKKGIIKGDGKDTYPAGALTHQQTATRLKRYHDKYIK
ncbi:hypothetical protein [Lysinibacillus xylanilyticus]